MRIFLQGNVHSISGHVASHMKLSHIRKKKTNIHIHIYILCPSYNSIVKIDRVLLI